MMILMKIHVIILMMDGDEDFYVNLYWILSPADGVPSTLSSSLCLELVMENLIMTMVDMMRVRMTMMVMVVIMVMMTEPIEPFLGEVTRPSTQPSKSI